jgi:ATPases of the AAA+ class
MSEKDASGAITSGADVDKALQPAAATPQVVAATPPASTEQSAPPAVVYDRPGFIDAISQAYHGRGKGVVVLSGASHDLYWSKEQKNFLPLEQTLLQALSPIFSVMRLDIATGIDFYDPEHRDAFKKVCQRYDGMAGAASDRIGNLEEKIASTQHSPLPALVLLSELLSRINKLRQTQKVAKEPPKDKVKPVCTIVQFAGSIFPAGDFDKLSEIDRQRLVTFLNMIESPWFKQSNHLVILIADTRMEINSRIIGLPSSQCVEIDLPNAAERDKFVETYLGTCPEGTDLFEKGRKLFVEDTAGLTLNAVDDLLAMARGAEVKVTRRAVLDEINEVLAADLGDTIKINRPEHGPKDIIGYAREVAILRDIFRRCDSKDTAVSAILVSGANGTGKTFLMEACAQESGRIVIELANLRSMYFGQTDIFFEKLRLRIRTYGKILILIDEAHTAFGSVHKSDTHETEKRLAGNIIKMMGDRAMFGKVLWGLMTSRPDELDPDVKSRSPIQIPIFDTEGAERVKYIVDAFQRKGIPLPEGDVDEVVKITALYSNRDLDNLVKEVKGSGRGALEQLKVYRASTSIRKKRYLQSLIAAQHCSYPELLPEKLRERVETDEFESEVARLKALIL